jgi:hypothetical protein
MIATCAGTMEKAGGQLVVVGAPGKVNQMFDPTRLDRVFFHLCEAPVVVHHRGGPADLDRLLPGQVAASLQAVNAHIHQRPAARQFPVEPPFARPQRESVVAVDGLDGPHIALADQLNGAEGEFKRIDALMTDLRVPQRI